MGSEMCIRDRADMGRFKYGRRAISGICYGLEEAMGDLDLADYHLNG